MNKLILSNEDIEFLLKWRDEHKNLVRMAVAPVKAIKIICKDSGYHLTGIREDGKLSLNVSYNGKSLGRMEYEVISGSFCRLIKDTTKLSVDDKQSCLTVYASAMALIVYGQSTVDFEQGEITRDIKPPKDPTTRKIRKVYNPTPGITYIMRRGASEPTIHIQGERHKPRGKFSVRGHYRHYKDGKVIWINEYVKGSGKPRSTTYKIKSSNSKLFNKEQNIETENI